MNLTRRQLIKGLAASALIPIVSIIGFRESKGVITTTIPIDSHSFQVGDIITFSGSDENFKIESITNSDANIYPVIY